MSSCTQKKRAISPETKLVISEINQYLEQAMSDSLSPEQKLKFIYQAQFLAKRKRIDSLILKAYNAKATFYNTHDPKNALIVLKDFEKLAIAKKDTLYIAHSYLNLGEYYAYLKQNNSALSYFNKSNIQFKNAKDSCNVVYSLLMMSGILKEKSDYYDMEAVNTEALKFIPSCDTNAKYNYSCIYNNLGIALKETFDYEKSLQYYKKARQYADHDFAKITLENNIAAVYTLSNEPKKALAILIPLEQQAKHFKDTKIHTRISNNIGLAYLKLNDGRSLDYFLRGLRIRQAENDHYGLMNCYAHLANYYKVNRKTIPLANQYALKSYIEATKLGVTEERLKALKILATTSFGQESSRYLENFFKLNDSLTAVKQKNKNQFAKIKYDFSEQMEQNQKLKAQETEKDLILANSKNQVLLLLILGIMTTGSTILLLNYLKKKRKKEILQEGYNTETRISKQLHDELANDMYHAMTFAETQNLVDENNKEILLNTLDLIYKRTRNISKENSPIDTGIHFDHYLKEMIADFSNSKVNILINGIESITFLHIEINIKIIIYRVLQELLVNMKKHSQCSIVVISFKKTAYNLQIEYSDNGIGIPPTKKNLKNGLQNVENRIDSINGTINFDVSSGKGFKVSLSIPV